MEKGVTAYAQWVEITIKPTRFDCKLDDLHLSWGKFYKNGDKDQEIDKDSIDGKTIGAGHSYSIYSCGREDAASGTEGSLSLYDGETKVAEIYWDCPWGSKHNKFSATVTDSVNYHIDTSGFNEYGGAIGNVIVSIEKLH